MYFDTEEQNEITTAMKYIYLKYEFQLINIKFLLNCSLRKPYPRGGLQEVVHGLERLCAEVVGLLHGEHGVLEVHLGPRVVPQESGDLPRHAAHDLVRRRIHVSKEKLDTSIAASHAELSPTANLIML